jgi:thiol:disulfide interchange protein
MEKMNNIIKTGLLTLVFTVIAMGLFGISTISMVGDVFGEKDQQGKNSNRGYYYG